jgi:hypothetical protein
MRLMRFPCFAAALTSVLWLFSRGAVSAEPVTVYLSGHVTYVEDPGGVLDGSVTVDAAFRGSYTFDTATPNTGSIPSVGDYWHTASPAGVHVVMGNYALDTDPAAVQFLVELVNDHSAGQLPVHQLREPPEQGSDRRDRLVAARRSHYGGSRRRDPPARGAGSLEMAGAFRPDGARERRSRAKGLHPRARGFRVTRASELLRRGVRVHRACDG